MWEFSREQAHVSAEQSAAQPYPWFPSADADPRWPRRHFGPASQGPRSPVRLTLGRSTTVLPRSLRMRSSKDFRRTTRRGVRASRPTLVVHAAHLDGGARVGFVVGTAVGNAVTRNRVKRRLRHLAAAQVADTPNGIGPGNIGIVVRALPRAATNPAEVPTDFGSAWHEAMSRLSAAGLMKQRVP